MALTRAKKPAIPSLTEIEYPDSDGKPLGETGVHLKVAVLDLLDVIQRYYDGNLDVAVQSNMFVYYVEGDPTRSRLPRPFRGPGSPFRHHSPELQGLDRGQGARLGGRGDIEKDPSRGSRKETRFVPRCS